MDIQKSNYGYPKNWIMNVQKNDFCRSIIRFLDICYSIYGYPKIKSWISKINPKLSCDITKYIIGYPKMNYGSGINSKTSPHSRNNKFFLAIFLSLSRHLNDFLIMLKDKVMIIISQYGSDFSVVLPFDFRSGAIMILTVQSAASVRCH